MILLYFASLAVNVSERVMFRLCGDGRGGGIISRGKGATCLNLN